MPEYLTPGVYVEETSFRSRPIEGVATSTFGMAGLTRYGPVPYTITLASGTVTTTPSPQLVTSFTEFERAFGGLGEVGADADRLNYLAYAARAFFANGGQRLYVSRVFPFVKTPGPNPPPDIDVDKNFASLALGQAGTIRARWPGLAAKEFAVWVSFTRGKNSFSGGSLKGLSAGAVVEVFSNGTEPKDDAAPATAQLRVVGNLTPTTLGLYRDDGTVEAVPAATTGAFHLTLTLNVRWGGRVDAYTGLELDTKGLSSRSIAKAMRAADPADDLALVWFDPGPNPATAAALVTALLPLRDPKKPSFLGLPADASDGAPLAASDLDGMEADPDDPSKAATGLHALAEVEDIAIVALPDAVRFDDPAEATEYLIQHCEAPHAYRIGIVDPPKESSISDVRQFRARFDTEYAALYYPWIEVLDPTARPVPGAPPAILQLPPSGFTAGIYARSDIERGVHKAPANEVVYGVRSFTQNVTFDRQAVLNPEGINALRFFEGRANRVWGARTMSSDPEWKYVNVRRLFLYLEHSIERATQWAVFEPNNERLWASIRQSVEDFLVTVWRTGALMGTKPEAAFFVRCDRTTMTQNDLDNGRMICLIGVAPTYPAEFVIFRIGQWTADAQQS
ncbi:phage tail sheath subtilisin-like domain-containing protein [uncultured Microbacterium sp.]|uniref:phage tail sheath family protein n=1 Tax=uncultured Microbacterium sp. TaxID=191216 RepID=UPI00261A7B20|nr:phage tail sheath subtilisin-like domain-containing protein [uncultured Microbacterium sp.]